MSHTNESIEGPNNKAIFIESQVNGKVSRKLSMDISGLHLTDEQKTGLLIEIEDSLKSSGRDLDNPTQHALHEELAWVQFTIEGNHLICSPKFATHTLQFSPRVWNTIAQIVAVSLQNLTSKKPIIQEILSNINDPVVQKRLAQLKVGFKAKISRLLKSFIQIEAAEKVEESQKRALELMQEKYNPDNDPLICNMFTQIIESLES